MASVGICQPGTSLAVFEKAKARHSPAPLTAPVFGSQRIAGPVRAPAAHLQSPALRKKFSVMAMASATDTKSVSGRMAELKQAGR